MPLQQDPNAAVQTAKSIGKNLLERSTVKVFVDFAQSAPISEDLILPCVNNLFSTTHALLENLKVPKSVEHKNELEFTKIVVQFNPNSAFPQILRYKKSEGYVPSYLASSPDRPYQMSFQHAHELVHGISIHVNKNVPESNLKPHANSWVEEVFAEVGSLYTLRKLGGDHNKYAYQRMFDVENEKPVDGKLAEWLKRNKKEISKPEFNRRLNIVAAKEILPLFEKFPEGWTAIAYLNVAPQTPGQSLKSYLNNWHKNVPPELKEFVSSVRAKFLETHWFLKMGSKLFG
jgi:hypothetical protein